MGREATMGPTSYLKHIEAAVAFRERSIFPLTSLKEEQQGNRPLT